ncbi:hypothetical protein ND861_18280 [Leptospira sp. 2 VSF19]|uniref:DUF2157 domain-containing protein n=1 Tax=Leptospira soteropolitanensis TaxID=2950025 RepID=A0AAW5VPP2_9LEPT|nr:hypothetical protein [Leptospira soteropolitanensis]MCW7494531.1 hypothetical protein [Leptospira soteropolitanensis]MCW7502125.1 hypothetical protein [Leptospira soteropolitanensis]MCW7524445.1 hypothetical protein [Leptospira soteropolitanensis]MCW7528311.1 hypothetical protein [Leptospira soteropolitanensis]MCW7532095.1 hypothetical protein [Leptospira soteropolitanensis]
MLKNLYILSENSWGVKSSEIFADFFYFLTLIGFLGYALAHVLPIPILPIAIGSLITLLYLGFCIRANQSPYWLGLLSQLLIVFLILPVNWLHPVLLPVALLFALVVHYLLNQQYSLRVPIFSLVLLFVLIWDSVFSLLGYSFRTPVELVSWTGIPFESSLLPLTLPWFSVHPFNNLTFLSFFDTLGIYVLVGISWVSFRRTVLLGFFLGWILLFSLWGIGSGQLGFNWILSFASLAFFLHLSPGRNFYGSYYVSLLSFVILLPIAFFLGKMGLSAVLVLVVFFLLEGLFVRVFLGK